MIGVGLRLRCATAIEKVIDNRMRPLGSGIVEAVRDALSHRTEPVEPVSILNATVIGNPIARSFERKS